MPSLCPAPLAACLLSLAVAACSADAAPQAKAASAASTKAAPQATSKPAPAASEHFGAAFTGAPAVELAALLTHPETPPDHPVRVEGMVRQACTRRGCWFELATALSKDAPGCRVVLKDHAFFVPLDSAGARARVEGHVQVKTVSAAQVAHMEEEGGHFPNKNPDGTALEVRIVASGVDLTRS